MKMAAQSEGQSDTGRTEVKTTSTKAPQIICGIGAFVTTLAIIAAITFNNSPRAPDPTVISTVQQAAETLVEPPASPPSAPIAIVDPNPVYRQTPSYAFNVPQAPAYAPDQQQAPSYTPDRSQQENQCSFVLPRKLYFVGQGVIRIRAGGFVSAPMSLDANPQEVLLPGLRPVAGPGVKETIFIDGDAGFIAMTSDLPNSRTVWTNLHGTQTHYATWKPLRKC
jgi:hypothetical protein